MITFRPLAGSARSDRIQPLAYLLQVDDVRILLDCGSPDWCPEQSTSAVTNEHLKDQAHHWQQYCDTLRELSPTIDLVLLSHGDLSHAGLFAYAYARWGLRCPAYSTLPAQAMARIAAIEETESIRDEADVGPDPDTTPASDAPDDHAMDIDDEEQGKDNSLAPERKDGERSKFIPTTFEIQEAFDSINTLRYSQPTHLSGKAQGLTITPFNAGHTIGGAIWKIRSPSAGTIVYAVDLNHMRERHLDATVMRQAAGGAFEPLLRPDLLITDAQRADAASSRRKDRDAALIDAITATLERRSSMLLPCDASSRVLEMLVLLDQHWSFARLKYPICLLSRTGREMLTFVRSMMEWLGGTVSKEDVGEEAGGNSHRGGRNKRKREDDVDEEAVGAFALRFKHLEFFPTPQALLQTYSSKDPKLILAVPASLSHGPSRVLFADFAAVPDNVILLTARGEPGTLSRVLFDRWDAAQREDTKWDKGKIGNNVLLDGTLKISLSSKVPLQGEELEEYLTKQKAERERAAAQAAAAARKQRLLEADADVDSSDSDSDTADEEDVERQLAGGAAHEEDDWEADGARLSLSFDIFLKGNVAKGATSFFRNAGREGRGFRMFPYVEKRRRVDTYGEVVDVGMWVRRGKIMEEEQENEEGKGGAEEEDAKKAPEEPPSKFISTPVNVQLACRLLYIDLEGLNDGRATKAIIPQVNPRKMVIVHAPQSGTNALIETCANIRTMTKDIYAPGLGDEVQIGQQTNSFSVSLSDELLASVRMSRFEDNEVGFVRGRITTSASSTMPVLDPLPPGAPLPSSANAPVSHIPRLAQRLPHSTMIGELKLTALKSRLAAVGICAEFAGEGVLVCGLRADGGLKDAVAVRKTGRGRVEMEGTACEVYYKVRKEIYGLHALVAA
ncbi:beta-lactamase-like protein [Vararia minispora EC-137]|uniref:Beta-lactamase-like protein n=1 Tax=Vararia minispora EC-137 TaxID=1314806 RepID=A0ACB8QJ14_9AGAM|nr:beta-lactamase-like protein [Vararia minispora EC-137]